MDNYFKWNYYYYLCCYRDIQYNYLLYEGVDILEQYFTE